SCWSAATRPDTRPCGCSAKPYTVTESARSPGSKAGRDGADHGAVQTPRARPLIAEDLHLQRQGIVLRGVVQLIVVHDEVRPEPDWSGCREGQSDDGIVA